MAAVALLCIVFVGVADDAYAADPPSSTESEPQEPIVTDITLSDYNLSMLPGDTETLQAHVYANSFYTVEWRSSNTSVVTVSGHSDDSCTVTARGSGTATITVTAGEESVTCTVRVEQVTISLDKTSVTTLPGGDVSIDITLGPSQWESQLRYELDYEISNPNVISWDGYSIYGKEAGSATITFEVRNVTARCNVEVLEGSITAYSGNIDITIEEKDGVSLSGEANNYNSTDPGFLTATVSSRGVQNGSITSAASDFLEVCLQIVDDNCNWSPDIRVEFDGGTATKMSLDSKTMSVISGAGASLNASSDHGGVYLDKTSVGRLGNAAWSFTLGEVENTSSVEGASLFEVTMTSGNTNITSVAGNAIFTIPYDVGDSIQASSISTFALAADGSVTPLSTSYDAIDGSVSVTAKSWYRFGISEADVDYGGTGTSTLSYVIMVVIVILAVICVLFCYKYLRM